MKNDKKTNNQHFLHQWTQLPHFFKNLFVFLSFFIFFTLAIVMIWKRQLEKKTERVLQTVIEQHVAQKETPPPLPLPQVQDTVQLLSNRLTALEARVTQQPSALHVLHKLVALELTKGVLEGMIPLDVLKGFLQKTPDPWAASLLAPLASLTEIKSYAQLEAMLVLPTSQAPLSLWERIKRKINSLVRIRRLDEPEGSTFGQPEDIQKFLQARMLQKAMTCFEKLSPEEQTALASWKKAVQDRLTLEAAQKALLLESAKAIDP